MVSQKRVAVRAGLVWLSRHVAAIDIAGKKPLHKR
jgi:hypothetical protein